MEQLFNKFSDLDALEKEKERILNIFLDIKKGIVQLSELGIKIDSSKGVSQAAGALKEYESITQKAMAAQKLLEQTEKQLSDARKRSAAETQSSVGALGKYNDSIGGNVQKLEQLKEKLKQTTADIEKLSQFKGPAGNENADVVKELTQMQVQQFELKKQISETTRFIKNQTQEAIAAEGSLVQMRGRLNQLLQTYDELSAADKKATFGQTLLKDIEELTEVVSKEEQASKRFQRNVGNYQGSAKIIVEALKDVEEEITKLQQKQQGLQDLSKANPIGFKLQGGDNSLKEVTNQLGFAIQKSEALSAVVDKPQFLNIAAKVGDSVAEVRQFTKELISLEQQGLKDTEVYQQLQERLAQLTDEIGDTRAEVKALSSDTRSFDLFASGIGTVASAFQTGASAAELFGGTNEDVQKTIMKLVAIQNISNGVREIANDLTTRGSAANKAYAFVTAQVAIMTNSAATATQRWSAALKLSGIGLLIGALGFLADKMGLFGGNTEDSTKKLDSFNASLERSNSILQESINLIDRQTQLAIEAARQRLADEGEIVKITIDGLKQQEKKYLDVGKVRSEEFRKAVKETKEQIDILKQVDGVMGLEIPEGLLKLFDGLSLDRLSKEGIPNLAKAKDLMEKINTIKMSKPFEDFTEEGKKSFELLEAQIKSVQEAFSKADTTAFDVTLKGEQEKSRLAEEQEKKREEANKKSSAAAEKRASDAKRYAEQERRAANDLAQFRLNLAADERKVFKEADTAPLKFRIDAAKEELEIRKQAIELQKNFELKGENVTASQRILIREKAVDAIKTLEFQAIKDIAQMRQDDLERLRQEGRANTDNFAAKQQADLERDINNSKKDYERFLLRNAEQESVEKKKAADRLKAVLQTEGKSNEEKKKAQEAYAVEVLEIETRNHRVRLDNLIIFYQDQIRILQAVGEDTLEIESQLAKAKEELAGLGLKNETDVMSERVALLEQLKTGYQDLSDAIQNAFGSFIEGVFDRQKNAIQDQIQSIEDLKNADIQRINESTDAEEKKAARIKIIEARAQSEKEQLEKRQKEMDRRKAVFDRAFKAFQIGSSTIEEVAKIKLFVAELTAKTALNPLLAPLIPLAAAQIPIALGIGAANLVALLATPIPKFYKGVESSPEGLAEVAERGRELGIDRSGKITLYTEPQITYLTKGTKILPNRVTEDILQAAEQGREAFINYVTLHPATSGQDAKLLGEAVEELRRLNKKPPIFIYNESGIESTAYYQQQMKN